MVIGGPTMVVKEPSCGMLTFSFESMFANLSVNLSPACQAPPANGRV
jgi:hypothetical protein